jgi:uncharacterized protein YfaP (DUF2135 family)
MSNRIVLCVLLSAAWASNLAAQEVSIELPRAGWRSSEGEAAGFRQEVNYPASSVNAVGHATSALIRGAVTDAPKRAAPGKLVVNGVAMPMAIDESGHFERPYAFGPGSNSVEVRAPEGTARRRTQFYDSAAGRPQARLRIVLSWDSDGTDLDLHVISPDAAHVFYGNRVGPDGGALDVDVTTGYGPEIYANSAPQRGLYHVYINYYGSGADEGRVTIAQVAVVTGENTPAEKQRVFRMPLRKAGELMLVQSFVYP